MMKSIPNWMEKIKAMFQTTNQFPVFFQKREFAAYSVQFLLSHEEFSNNEFL